MRSEDITLDMINIKKMSRPHRAKLKHYGFYYELTGHLSHDIYIDKNKEIVAGYCSYLIAKKHNLPDYKIHFVTTDKLTKVVYCKHMHNKNNKIKLTHKLYAYKFPLKYAVVPGDIVIVKKQGYYNTLVVQSIEYYEKDSIPIITESISKITPFMLSKDSGNNLVITKLYKTRCYNVKEKNENIRD